MGAVPALQEALAEAKGEIEEGLGLPVREQVTVIAALRKEPGWVFLWGRRAHDVGGG